MTRLERIWIELRTAKNGLNFIDNIQPEAFPGGTEYVRADCMAEAVALLRELESAGGTAVHFKHQKTNALLELEAATKRARAFLASQGQPA